MRKRDAVQVGGTAVIIPARWGSTRFPGKVLALLGGKPIVRWCHEAAVASRIGPVAVATDDLEVVRAVEAFGGRAVMTPKNLASGTDRVLAALKRLRWSPRFVVNLQGDEPLISPSGLRSLDRLLRSAGADVATLVTPLKGAERLQRPDVVKAVLAKDGRALYFSRSPVPYRRQPPPARGVRLSPSGTAVPCRQEEPRRWEHIGIYGYKAASLRRFVSLPPSPLERAESLEQLRALEDGMSIYAAVVPARGVAIDTPADLAQAERLIQKRRSP
ncbi:MAG: 3-deoxy-manno-octulosonate cytidylyltransferase [Elusimicrobia bacterium]|nr:3-deoxy-manno-octulosonate cytidylyltransferase [Elusimicrobiota bacterium]